MKDTIRDGVLVGVCALGLCSCATVQPYVSQPNYVANSQTEPLFAAAVSRANTARNELHSKLLQSDIFDFWTATGLLGTAIAGLTLGLFDSSKDALLGVGAAGASLVAARTLVPSSARKVIYINGEKAIGCAITALQLRPSTQVTTSSKDMHHDLAGGVELGATPSKLTLNANSQQLDLALGTLLERSQKLSDRLQEAKDSLSTLRLRTHTRPGTYELSAVTAAYASQVESKVDQLADAREQSDQALRRTKATLIETDAERAARLDNAVAAIVQAVNMQVVDNGIDLQAALSAAQAHVGVFVENARSTAKEAKAKAKQLEEKAGETKSAAAAVKEATPTLLGKGNAEIGAVMVDTAESSDHVEEIAQNAKDLANDIDSQMDQIIRSLDIPKVCFSGLIARGNS